MCGWTHTHTHRCRTHIHVCKDPYTHIDKSTWTPIQTNKKKMCTETHTHTDKHQQGHTHAHKDRRQTHTHLQTNKCKCKGLTHTHAPRHTKTNQEVHKNTHTHRDKRTWTHTHRDTHRYTDSHTHGLTNLCVRMPTHTCTQWCHRQRWNQAAPGAERRLRKNSRGRKDGSWKSTGWKGGGGCRKRRGWRFSALHFIQTLYGSVNQELIWAFIYLSFVDCLQPSSSMCSSDGWGGGVTHTDTHAHTDTQPHTHTEDLKINLTSALRCS